MNVWWPHDSVMKVVLTWIMCFLKIIENTYGDEFAIVKEAKKGSIIVVFKNYSNFKGSWTQLPKLKFCPIFKKIISEALFIFSTPQKKILTRQNFLFGNYVGRFSHTSPPNFFQFTAHCIMHLQFSWVFNDLCYAFFSFW